jgi:hypothetical protein
MRTKPYGPHTIYSLVYVKDNDKAVTVPEAKLRNVERLLTELKEGKVKRIESITVVRLN